MTEQWYDLPQALASTAAVDTTAVAATTAVTVSSTVSTVGIALGAAVGTAVGEVFGAAIGVPGAHFSWKQIATSAIGAAISVNIPNIFGLEAGTDAAAAARSAIGYALSQGTDQILGLPHTFSWKGMIGSAIGSAVGNQLAINTGLQDPTTGRSLPQATATFSDELNLLEKQSAVGIAGALTTAVTKGGKYDAVQVATDAFGNVLGSALGQASSPIVNRFLSGSGSAGAGSTETGNTETGTTGANPSPQGGNADSIPPDVQAALDRRNTVTGPTASDWTAPEMNSPYYRAGEVSVPTAYYDAANTGNRPTGPNDTADNSDPIIVLPTAVITVPRPAPDPSIAPPQQPDFTGLSASTANVNSNNYKINPTTILAGGYQAARGVNLASNRFDVHSYLFGSAKPNANSPMTMEDMFLKNPKTNILQFYKFPQYGLNNTSQDLINDTAARKKLYIDYLNKAKPEFMLPKTAAAAEYRAAAEKASALRNNRLNITRSVLSTAGLEYSERLKSEGIPYGKVVEKTLKRVEAEELAGKLSFKNDDERSTEVSKRIIESAFKPNPHINESVVRTANIVTGQQVGSVLAPTGKLLSVAGAAIDGYNFGIAASQSYDTGSIQPVARESLRIGSAWASAYGVGIAGAELGATLGLSGGVFAPITVPVAGAIGGLVGGAIGYYLGSTVSTTVFDATVKK